MHRDAFACHAGAGAQPGAESVPFGFPNVSAKLKFNFSERIEATPELTALRRELRNQSGYDQAERAFDAASTQKLRWAQSGRFSRMFLLAEITQCMDGHER